ncbi:PAS domain S-box protein [Candidatus Bathyarchaeota archaeon]|nr:PAS domain S-box protein [Candidatus Bathyarchaeota archaeon]
MRSYLFTEWERERIIEFLNYGTIPDGFPIIKTRMLKNLPKITEDFKLGFEFWSALQNEASPELRGFALNSHMWYLEHLKETSSDISDIIIDDVKRELISKNMMFQAAIENSYCGIIISNTDHKIIYVNKAMTEITGKSKNQMIGKKSNIFFPENKGYVEWVRKQLFEEGRFNHTVYTGEPIGKWIEIEATTITQEGELIATIAWVRDVTIRKNLEQQVKELIEQLTSPSNQEI